MEEWTTSGREGIRGKKKEKMTKKREKKKKWCRK
jgi:hypothetical protein